ncbi:MAG: signal peptidase I [Oscillospiraceae bacterium]|nr:signal peptidase I [Oscillospiraceae bacterium]
MAGYELNYEALDDDKEKKPSAAEEFIDWVETVICAFFVVILIFTFILRIANVDGGSMLPTLVEGDRLIVSHLMYTPEAGDIVIVNTEHPVRACESCGQIVYDMETASCPSCGKIDTLHVQKNEKAIVKRVIATENQQVDIDITTGVVTVDGVALDESYILEPTATDEGYHNYPVTVPEGCVFVMGDNRNNSTDSRSSWLGFVEEEDILGKVILRVFPFNSIGVPA